MSPVKHDVVVLDLGVRHGAFIAVIDIERTQNHDVQKRNQEPRSGFEPGLIPEHSVLPYFLEEDFPKSDRRGFNRAGMKIASALHDGVRVSAGEDTHLVAAGPNGLDALELKLRR